MRVCAVPSRPSVATIPLETTSGGRRRGGASCEPAGRRERAEPCHGAWSHRDRARRWERGDLEGATESHGAGSEAHHQTWTVTVAVARATLRAGIAGIVGSAQTRRAGLDPALGGGFVTMNRDNQRDFLPDEMLAARESEDVVALEKTRRMLRDPEFAAELAKLKEEREAGVDPLHWDPYAEGAVRKAGASEKAQYVAPVAVPEAGEHETLEPQSKKVQLAAGIDPRRVPTQPKLSAVDAPSPAGAPERSARPRGSAPRMRRLAFLLLAVLAVVAPAALVAVLWVDASPIAPGAMGTASAAGLPGLHASSGVRAPPTSAPDSTAPASPSSAPGSSTSAHVPVPAPGPAPAVQESDAGSVKQPAPASPRGTAPSPSWSQPKATTSRPGAPPPSATPAPVPPVDPAEPTEIF
jgi:hypothetical protein